MNGMQMDEDGSIYFVTARPKLYDGRHFLSGQGGTIGAPKGNGNSWPFTGTLVKSKPRTRVKMVLRKAVIPMDIPPKRPTELRTVNFPGDQHANEKLDCWAEGAEWLYAGASPIVSTGCSCFREHLGLDWYKRAYVPEAYRHSIGVLDTNGNLIMHVGRYGNFDSASGPKSRVPVGGDGIGLMITRFISATDNYLGFGDWSEKITVLRLDYHAEETAAIGTN
jgi:hypothetical protein